MTDRSAADDRWAWAEIDLDAIRHNVAHLAGVAAPAKLWAVVKAGGYGHGAVEVARAAIDAGAAGLCVALVQEGVELRAAGIDAPILILSEQPIGQIDDLLASGLTPTVYSDEIVTGLEDALRRVDAPIGPYPVHVKVDTGMQRVGMAPTAVPDLVERISASPHLRLDGVFTHLACADEPGSSATEEQLAVFDDVLAQLDARGHTPPTTHVANSAAILRVPASHRSLVRAGIAIYGISPGPALDAEAAALRPAMRLVARVSHVKRVAAGTHVSYGWRHRFERSTTVATLPIGYADGVPRRMGTLPGRAGADVLIGGRRCPIVGVVTMDQLVVDCGDVPVSIGDEAVLIGEQGAEHIRAEDWAERLDTIGYEIVCAISSRVPRSHR
jgi:alanine racemase